MNNLLLEKLASVLPKNSAGFPPEILTGASLEYNVKRQVFNTKFQFRPSAIVMVETPEQVSTIVKFANKFPAEIVLRVRSGGHDHEGESSGTDTLLIDFSKMNAVKVEPGEAGKERIVSIGPGARFQHIKPILDEHGIGIAHGTCETVGIAGFTMGGGWGPWTRRYGMGCERLIGATIVLGNGEIKVLDHESKDQAERDLLWALRGGGGLSYGIATELKFKAFVLPDSLLSFNLLCHEAWPTRTAFEILKHWESAINDIENKNLLGTNLKVAAKHLPANKQPNPNEFLDCTFNGYFEGTQAEAIKMVEKYFWPLPDHYKLTTQAQHKRKTNQTGTATPNQWHFESWDRQVPSKLELLKTLSGEINSEINSKIQDCIQLEDDGPAPHKITSRLADANWGDESIKALICSLQSPLVPAESDTMVPTMSGKMKKNDFAINHYITLGAIRGPFYAHYDKTNDSQSAFPYKDRPFTIQYQTWWNQYLNTEGLPKSTIDTTKLGHLLEELATRIEGDTIIREELRKAIARIGLFMKELEDFTEITKIEVDVLANRPWINRAEDWIEACRNYPIPNTSGAFISFKDSSVRTETYFSKSYERLREIKEKHSKDKYVLFRSRKTII